MTTLTAKVTTPNNVKGAADSDLSAGWRCVRLGDVLRLRKDVVHPRNNPSGPATFVGLEHIESHTGRRIGAVELEMSLMTGRKPRFRKGEIVYGYLRPYLNKVWIAEFDGLCSVDQYVYEVNCDIVDTEFVAWFMRSPTYLRRAPIDTTPGQLPRIRTEEVAAVEMELPPLAEQRRIAGRLREQLAEVAKARTAVQAQLAAAKAFPAALLRDVFDHPENREREINRLGEALRDIEAGKCMSCVERRAGPNEWGVLKVSAVTWGTFRPEENKVLPPDFVVPTEHEVQPGDFLISRSNTTELVGAVVLVRETRPKLMLSDKTLRLVLNEDVVAKEYLEWALRTSRCRDFIEQNSTGTSGSMKNITQDSIRNIPLALPTLDEQRTIAARLAAELAEVTRLRQSLSGKLEALDRLPAALLAQAFQGDSSHKG